MRYLVLIIAAIVLMPVCSAQDDPREFNEAWYAYVEAKGSGSDEDVLVAAKTVLEKGQQLLEANDERLPPLMKNYGEALYAVGDTDAARDVLQNTVELSEQIHGKDAPASIPIVMAYADSLAEPRNAGAQERHYRKALKIAEKNTGKASKEYADVAFRAGVRIYERSRTTSGKRYLEDAYEIYSGELGPASTEAGLTAYYLAKSEYSERDFKGSTEWGLLALDGLQQSPQYLGFARALLVQGYERRGMSDEATEHCVAIGRDSMISPNQDYLPLFRLAPKYPSGMLSSGREGYVDIEFTVDEQGFVRDPAVIGGDGGRPFEKEALAAVRKFRYAPKFVDGEAVATDGVKTRITFQLTK